jgi:hypothetical protein
MGVPPRVAESWIEWSEVLETAERALDEMHVVVTRRDRDRDRRDGDRRVVARVRRPMVVGARTRVGDAADGVAVRIGEAHEAAAGYDHVVGAAVEEPAERVAGERVVPHGITGREGVPREIDHVERGVVDDGGVAAEDRDDVDDRRRERRGRRRPIDDGRTDDEARR